jgi:hypothetical protein
MFRARSWILAGVIVAAIALWPRALLAQTTPQDASDCVLSAERTADLRGRVMAWRRQEFDAFRRRLVNADLAGATQPSDALVVTGGLNDDKTTAKAQVATAFLGAGTIAVSGSLTSPGATSIDLFDPLRVATDYSTKVTFGWSQWKNVPVESKLRDDVCAGLSRLQSFSTTMSSSDALHRSAVLGASYELGRSTFAYADPANGYQETSERHRAQAINLSGGYVFAERDGDSTEPAKYRWITTIVATYQRRWAHEAGSDTTRFVCHPIPNSTASACGTTPLPGAAPVSRPGHAFQLDARHFFSWPIAPGFRFTKDITASFNTFEAPVYLFSKDEKNRFSFTGGVTAGYRDGGAAKGRFAAVFFGAAARPEKKF